jgi:CRISPR-associated protein Cas1
MAAQHNIAVLIYNNKGKVLARVWQTHFGSHSAIRIQQLQFSKNQKAIDYMQQLLTAKAELQLSNLKYLKDRKPGYANALAHPIGHFENYLHQFKTQSVSEKPLLLYGEAKLSKIYWAAIALILESYTGFTGRSRRPARDKFNALLNYYYGILYGMVEGALLAAGLDPHIGMLHRDEYNTPSFVFDCIEPFRPWADKLLIEQTLAHQLHETWFEKTNEGIVLAKEGKKNVIPAFFDYMNERTYFNHKRIKRKDQIQHLATTLAQQLLKQHL